MKTETYLTVGALAKAAGLHPDTIRSYCRQRLLQASLDSSGRRLFTRRDVGRAMEIAEEKRRRK